ncbi:MAG TPA: 3-hydroxyacyl-ACP dehydratase FabZ family protein [Verrucomicrobiae bacterium]|nr:3-hydroxyacyl-ACP dehydratase FabZ family protein [Verrucomicrobiae bacterium]
MSLTPHGPGFSFLDSFEILEGGRSGRGHKWLNPQSPFFADHFPGNPLMPGVLLIECAAQAAGVLWEQPGAAYLAGVRDFRFRKPVLPGQTVDIDVTLDKEMGAFAQFDAVLSVGPVVVAQGKLTLSRALSSAV